VVSEIDKPASPDAEGIELEISDLDLSSIDSIEGTALWYILQDLYGTSRDITVGSSPHGPVFSSFSSFNAFSAFFSFSSRISGPGRA
jgi:hypothetical protein